MSRFASCLGVARSIAVFGLLTPACVPAGASWSWPGNAPVGFIVRLDRGGTVRSISGPILDGASSPQPIAADETAVILDVELAELALRSSRVDLESLARFAIGPRTSSLDGCESEGNVTADTLEIRLDDAVGSKTVSAFERQPGEEVFRSTPVSSISALSSLSLRVPLRASCDPGFRLQLRPFGQTSPYFDLSTSSVVIGETPRALARGHAYFQDARLITPDRLLVLSGWHILLVDRGQAWRDRPGDSITLLADNAGYFPGAPSEWAFFGDGVEFWPGSGTGVMVFTAFDQARDSAGATAWLPFSAVDGQLELGTGGLTRRETSARSFNFSDIASDPSGEYVAVGFGIIQTATTSFATPVVMQSSMEGASRVEWVRGLDERYIYGAETGVLVGRPAGGLDGLAPLGTRFELGRISSLVGEEIDGLLEVHAGSSAGQLSRYRGGSWQTLPLELPEEGHSCTVERCGRRVAAGVKVSALTVVTDDTGHRRLLFILEDCAAVFAVDVGGQCVTAAPFVAADGDPSRESIAGLEWDVDVLVPLGDKALIVGQPALIEEIDITSY